MGKIAARYTEKGLLVVGVHVTRRPRIRENNIVYALEHLKPNFPVIDTAWVGQTPVSHLPWVAVFDHEGERIYAGRFDRIGQIVEDALARAPHPVVGGPYGELGQLASEIAADRAGLGGHLHALRQRLAAGGDEGARLEEVRALLESIENYGYGRAEKIITGIPNPAEAAPALRSLAARFEGDVIGELVSLIADSIESAPRIEKERIALGALVEARALFRKIPPAGTYAYNLEYTPVTDRDRLAERERLIARYSESLEKIADTHRTTCAAAAARDLLEEILPRAGDREAGEEADGDLVDAAERIMNEFHEIGSGLSRERAKELGTQLREISREVGAQTGLAREIRSFMRDEEWSFEGPAMPDFLIDAVHEGPGIAVRTVFGHGCAQRAGLEAGDLIIGGDGERIVDFRGFYRHLANCRPGQRVSLLVQKGPSAEPGTVELVLGRRLR